MSAYADYTFYTTTFLGSLIASADFAQKALRASEEIDRLTFNRAATVISDDDDADLVALIKMATCAVAETLQTIETGSSDSIKSESVGSHSVTYGDSSDAALTNNQRKEKAARTYLGGTGLMYRGFLAGEYGGETTDDE